MKSEKTFLLFLATFLLASCTIQKRQYMPGYSIDFKGKNLSAKENVTSPTELILHKTVQAKTISIIDDSCDLIELKNKTTIHANIKSIDSKTITYNDCNTPSSKEHTINKSEIIKIIYKNGTIKNYHDYNCDIIELKDKSTKKIKVIKIGSEQIEYKNCDNIDGPNELINKSDVTQIAYSDGHFEKYGQSKTNKYIEPLKGENGMSDSAFYQAKKIVALPNGKYQQNSFILNQLLFWKILEKSENPTINKLLKESKKQTNRKQLGILIIPLAIFFIIFPLFAIMAIPITLSGFIFCEAICALAIIFFAILSHRGNGKKRIVDSEAVKLYNEDILK